MKRILFAALLATATCTVTCSLQHACAQTPAPKHISQADFTAKINLMDSQIGAGNLTAAQGTWKEVLGMMINVFGISKQSIQGASSTTDRDSYLAILQNQQNIYFDIMKLKDDMATNRTALHSKLVLFGGTIY